MKIKIKTKYKNKIKYKFSVLTSKTFLYIINIYLGDEIWKKN